MPWIVYFPMIFLYRVFFTSFILLAWVNSSIHERINWKWKFRSCDIILEFELPLLLQTYNILGCISKNNMNPQHICFDDVRGLGNRVKKRSIGDKKKARSRYKWNVNCGRALEEWGAAVIHWERKECGESTRKWTNYLQCVTESCPFTKPSGA